MRPTSRTNRFVKDLAGRRAVVCNQASMEQNEMLQAKLLWPRNTQGLVYVCVAWYMAWYMGVWPEIRVYGLVYVYMACYTGVWPGICVYGLVYVCMAWYTGVWPGICVYGLVYGCVAWYMGEWPVHMYMA